MILFLSFLVACFVIAVGWLWLKQKAMKSTDLLTTMQKKDWDQADAFLVAAKSMKPKEKWADRKEREFQAMDIHWNLRKHMMLMLISIVIGALIGMWLLKAPLLVILAAIAGSRFPNLYVKQKIRKNREVFDHQYRNALIRLAALTRASSSIQQGFWELATTKDSPERIRKEFYLAFADMNYGKTADEALLQMAHRTQSEDVRMTALMVKIHRMKGGNLIELLEGIQETISLRSQQKRKMKTMTAQQMSQANLLSALPFVTFLLFSIANPGYYGNFLASIKGQLIFIACVGMILLGKKMMNAIIGVKGD